MGSIFAVLAAQYIGGFENLIMVSPTHVPFEGTRKNKKTMTGKSVATWKGEDIPFVKADFSKIRATGYYRHPDAKCKVTGMWIAYHDAYMDERAVINAKLSVEKTNARVLLIAGDEDEAWPAEHSVRLIEKDLKDKGYGKDVKVIVYPHGSHFNGLMPNREREKRLYRMIPLIGLMYRTFGKYKDLNISYFDNTEKEIIKWLNA
jgi:pimeloyl-ACP methyl ester carboxylesterase